uniref:Uncharacterized protein n=1 Tax=Timema tahoe TaxID=61484 RepID=A0A7R9IS04_9NEOP|nr:unnamed protein product [Timema tahoe]
MAAQTSLQPRSTVLVCAGGWINKVPGPLDTTEGSAGQKPGGRKKRLVDSAAMGAPLPYNPYTSQMAPGMAPNMAPNMAPGMAPNMYSQPPPYTQVYRWFSVSSTSELQDLCVECRHTLSWVMGYTACTPYKKRRKGYELKQ